MRAAYLPAILLCLILIAQPVLAQDVTFTAPDGKGIVNVMLISNVDTTGSITFSFNDGTTETGSWSYVTTGLLRQATISIGGESVSKTYVTLGSYRTGYFLPGNVNSLSNTSESRVKVTGGQWDVPDLGTSVSSTASPVISVSFTTDNDLISYDIETLDMDMVNKNMRGDMSISLCGDGNSIWVCGIMEVAKETFWNAIDFIKSIIYWLKFFFIDNLMLVIGLYISVSMVFAARASRGHIPRFFSKFITQQVKLFQFIMDVWRMLIESIGTIRGWFRI